MSTTDFGAALADANNNFSNASISALDPQAAANDRLQNMALASGVPLLSPNVPGFQTVQKCFANYNQIPYGWRPSAFMGECGFKIQLKKFYEADSPCYPVQDISCMGPKEKQAWASICATEFPCGPPPPSLFKFGQPQAIPGNVGKANIFAAFTTAISDNISIMVGMLAFSCCLVRASTKGGTTSESAHSDAEDSDSDTSKPN